MENTGTEEALLNEMDEQKNIFTNVKAHFPTMNEAVLGKKELQTAPYYRSKGIYITFTLDRAITGDDIKQNNTITRWMNENYIVRLYALLEAYGIISDKMKIDTSIEGADDIDILRRLRDILAHGTGKYNPFDENQRKLVERMIVRYGIKAKDHLHEMPLAIDTIIDPLFNGCREYVQRVEKGGESA
jgi:hypothetical protein